MSYLDLTAALAVAVAGGWHCAGMCGGIAALATQKSDMLWSQLGRLVSYAIMGALATLVGARILSVVPGEVRWVATITLAILAFWLMGSTSNLGISQNMQKFLWRNRPRQFRALEYFSLGLLNGLLPCHWLYGYLIAAMTLKSPLQGSFFLGMLWLGSVPWLLGAQKFMGLLRKRFGSSPWLARGWILFIFACLVVQSLPHQSHSDHKPSTPPLLCNRKSVSN